MGAQDAIEYVDVMKHFEQNARNGNFAVVYGKIRVGKSHYVSILTRQALNRGWSVISNVRYQDDVINYFKDRLFYITSDLDFFKAYINTRGPTIMIWDDAQATAGSSKDSSSKKGRDLDDLLIFIGKFDSNLVFVAHLDYIPKCVYQQSPLYIYKFTKWDIFTGYRFTPFKNDVYESDDFTRAIIPRKLKPLPFKTRGFPNFEIELPLKRMWKSLSKYDGNELREAVARFLESWERDKDNKRIENITWVDLGRALIRKNLHRKVTIEALSKSKVYDAIPRAEWQRAKNIEKQQLK